MYKASASIIQYLKQKELFKAKAYADGSSWAIGYGHQIKPNETSLKTSVVSESWANTQLLQDIQPLENLINKSSKPVSGQPMFDALVEFGYNCGSGSLTKALGVWKSGDKNDLCKYILQYIYYTDASGIKRVSASLQERRNYDVELIRGSISRLNLPALASALAATLVLFILRPKF